MRGSWITGGNPTVVNRQLDSQMVAGQDIESRNCVQGSQLTASVS